MNRFYQSKYLPLIFIPISFLFLMIYSWATSPLFLTDGIDSSIFKTIGLGIAQGKLPYVDLFDHKGGMLFFIEAAGCAIELGRWGLFLIQVLFLSITLFIMFKTSNLFVGRKESLGASLITLFLYITFMESGNQCEFYALPMMCLSLFLALKYLVQHPNSTHPLSYSLVYGIAFAFVFWIRPNDAVSQIGAIMFGIFIYLIYRKQYVNAAINALAFLGGCAIITIPFFIYFWHHGIVYELLNGTFLYNLKYVSDGGEMSIMTLLVPTIIFGALIWTARRFSRNNLLWILIPLLTLTLLLIGKRDYAHYLIIILPATLVLITFIIKSKRKLILGIIIIIISLSSIRQHQYVYYSFQAQDCIESFLSQTRRLISQVPEKERMQIWNLNLMTSSTGEYPQVCSQLSAFIDSEITPCNRIFVNFHLDNFGQEETIYVQKPKWMLADSSKEDFNGYKEFIDTHYTAIDKTEGSCVGDIVLFRLKDACE